MADKVLKIIIAGGGTGGHIFPGVAIAEEFIKREDAAVLFIGTGNKLEKDILGGLGFNYCAIRVAGFKGKEPLRVLSALAKLPLSMWESYRIIREFRPRIVIGVGGYASGPVVLIAHLLGIKTAVAEQNALPGLANRILGKFADRIFLTYRETKKWFPLGRTFVTGNPVRANLVAGGEVEKEKGGRFTILVFGGSQGARAINRAILNSLPFLCAEKLVIRIIHQTGQAELAYVAGVYQTLEVEAEVLPFIRDMAAAYRAADLVICRAGATSLAEITVLGKAAVLIPFPFAVDDHQTKNAIEMVRVGAAVMIEEKGLTGEELAGMITQFYHRRDLLREMEIKSAVLGNIRAAADIVDNCRALL